MFSIKSIAGACALCFLSGQALADDPLISVSGFGTVGLVKTNSNDVQYVNDLQWAGADKHWDSSIDTKLGLQLSAKPMDHFNLVAQVVSSKDRDSSFRPKFEWAFAKYEVTNDVSVRVGRLGLPGFLISDYRNVGYSLPWARPPVEVYNQLAILNFDGADAIWRINANDNTFTIQPYAGSSSFRSYNYFDGDAKKILGINGTWENGSWTVRAGYVRTNLTGTSNLLQAGVFGNVPTSLRTRLASVPQVQKAINELEVKDKFGYFTGVGLIYDNSEWLFETEYAKRHSDSLLTDTASWYLTSGYRIGDVTPYVSYSTVSSTRNTMADQIPELSPTLIGVKRSLDALANRNGANQDSIAIGARWNVAKGIALKAQYDQVSTKEGKANLLQPVPNTFSGKKLNVYSLTADFVF